LLLVLSTVLAACGSSGGEGGGNNVSPSASDNPVNIGLSGQVFSVGVGSGRGALWKMNLNTGRFTKIPGTNWEEDDDYHNLAIFLLSPAAYEGNEFILRVQNCLPSDTGTSCVVTLDENAIKTKQFVLPGRINSIVKMSRDRRYVALTIQYGGSITNDTWLEIYDRDGKLVSDDRVGTTLVNLSFEWLPDGRLVYSSSAGDERSIYFTSPYSAKVERQLTLPEGQQRTIGEISASPDGKQIVLSLVAEANFASTKAIPWVVNIDGTNFRQLAFDPHADNLEHTRINKTKWSYDGRWILLKYGGVIGGSLANPGTLGYLFAVPSDGIRVPLSPYDATIESTAIQIFSYWSAAFNEQADSTRNIDRWPRMDYDWVP